MKNLYTKTEFLNKINENNQLNEGILGKLFGWAGDLIKQGKIKASLNKYEKELPEKTKERLIEEFNLEIAKKSGADTKEIEETINLLKEEEQLIKDGLNLAIQEVEKKKPELKLKLKRLKLSTEKAIIVKMRENLKGIMNDDERFKEIKKSITDKMKQINSKEQELTSELDKIENSEKGKKLGELYYYEPKDFVTDNAKNELLKKGNIIILTKVEKDEKGNVKDIMAKTIWSYDEDKIRLKDDEKITEFTPTTNNIKEQIVEEDEISKIFASEEGKDDGLDNYKQYKEDLVPKPEKTEEKTEEPT